MSERELPISENTSGWFDPKVGIFDKKAEELRQKILSLPDTVAPSVDGTTYYISYRGDDARDGTSPATAWKSATMLFNAPLKKGDVVLFERGGVYRGCQRLPLISGVNYAAYGEGPKPCLYGSPRNYAAPVYWEKTQDANVWAMTPEGHVTTPEEIAAKPDRVYEDVGAIVFDHGRQIASAGKKLDYTLTEDLDFYYDMAENRLYLYLAAGNPGDVYADIEVITEGSILHHDSSRPNSELYDPVIIENLCMKYANFGIGASYVHSMIVRGCEIGYIGGCMANKTVRFGNGIEIFNHIYHLVVENNWIYQCYDAGYTNQGHVGVQDNITVRDNLIEYCHYNIEVFESPKNGGAVTNTVYENNILRFAGYGFGSYNRIGGCTTQAANIRNPLGIQNVKNFFVRGNVFDRAQFRLVNSGFVDGVRGPIFEGNTWALCREDNAMAVKIILQGETVRDAVELAATYRTTMEAAVALVDKTATVIFEE